LLYCAVDEGSLILPQTSPLFLLNLFFPFKTLS
jgi:hypothetical protein